MMRRPNPSASACTCSPVVCFILPPDVLERVAREGGDEDRQAAMKTLAASSGMRARRSVVGNVLRELNVPLADVPFLALPKGERRTVYDVEGGGSFDLPGKKVRGEGDPPSDDESVNEAYDGADKTYDLYKEVYGRDSLDDRGMELISSVHYGVDFDNAFWQGSQMVYGDGSGRIFAKGGLTKAVDVIGHEMTHGVVQFTAGLIYRKQSGALNESFADVMGSLVKQYSRDQSADEADWILGEGILGPALNGKGLRSLKEPGTAYEGDRQPGHMDDYVDLPDDNDPSNDNGGVHINSGIPNRAFQLAATAIGGKAWEKAGQIWYTTLTSKLDANAQFVPTAEATVEVAGELFGSGSDEETAVRQAWEEVGVL
ncbi:MAG: M4 family metallopeptidase [Actinomycetota bacterium]|nr:M4 family metallopeptidase [Actinomycetota bacterium]